MKLKALWLTLLGFITLREADLYVNTAVSLFVFIPSLGVKELIKRSLPR